MTLLLDARKAATLVGVPARTLLELARRNAVPAGSGTTALVAQALAGPRRAGDGVSPRRYRPRVAVRLDHATDGPVCVLCEASLEDMTEQARFCSKTCRNRYHARQQRQRAKEAAA